VAEYHALLTLNAVLGGQFTSRLNRNLRETRGITYGARSAFVMYRDAGTFVCETSVQADQTAVAVAEAIAEIRAVREPGAVSADELALAKASLTRGYVRQFETAAQIVRGLVEMAAYELPHDSIDRFVPAVSAVSDADLLRAARETLHPDDCRVVVVGDARVCRAPLEAAGWTVLAAEPEF
jgi:predicted Zn-dependent peptidase